MYPIYTINCDYKYYIYCNYEAKLTNLCKIFTCIQVYNTAKKNRINDNNTKSTIETGNAKYNSLKNTKYMKYSK